MNQVAEFMAELFKVFMLLAAMLIPVMYLISRANRTRLDRSKAELLLELKRQSELIQKQSDRLRNLESIVTSPDYVSSQLSKPGFEQLTDEEQSAELARLIAAREGRITT